MLENIQLSVLRPRDKEGFHVVLLARARALRELKTDPQSGRAFLLANSRHTEKVPASLEINNH
jgi:hypothetical protein